jgi:hypothetical protein
MEISNFDKTVNEALNEAFGTPGKVRSRKFIYGKGVTSRDPNTWKDPLKKHHMKSSRGLNRKHPYWVPKTHQAETALSAGDSILKIAKDADQGIWEINLAQAVPMCKKYKMNLPTAKKPVKRLGSTGIVMYLRWDNNQRRYRLYLVKHNLLVGQAIKARKSLKKKFKGKLFKGVYSSKFSKKRPQKPVEPMFQKGFVTKTA